MTLPFRRWTHLFFALMLAAVLLFTFAISHSSSETIRRQVLESYDSSTSFYARILSDDLHRVDLTLGNLLYTQTTTLYEAERRGGDVASLLAAQSLSTLLAQNAQLSAAVDGAFFLRPDGSLLLAQYAIYSLSDLDALEEILADRDSPKGRWFCRRVNRRWCLIHTFRFSNSLLGVYVDAENLLKGFDEGGQLAVDDYCLLGEEGLVYANSLCGQETEEMRLPDSGDVRLSGRRYAPVTAPLSVGGIRLAALVSEGSLMGGIWRNYTIAGVFALLMLAALLLIYQLAQRHLLRPFLALSDAMKAFREGNVDARVTSHSPVREMNDTTAAFNSMAGEVVRLKIENYESALLRSRTEMQFYQLQIQPHFLINTLNTIYSLAQVKNYALIQELTLFLVKYYRYTIKATGDFVCLRDELEHVRNYLGIHQMRLGDRLDVDFDVDEECLDTAIPPLVLHTFVENTVQYAVSMDDVTFLGIEVHRLPGEERMRITISDTGAGFPEDSLSEEPVRRDGREHIGMYNVRQRLSIAYKGKAELRLANTRPHGARVDIIVPVIPFGLGKEAKPC